MPKIGKRVGKKIAKPRIRLELKSLFAIKPILPHLLIIAASIGIYYAMIHFYLFFTWGFYIYYAIRLIIPITILAAAFRSVTLPLAAAILSLAILFTNNHFLNNLMDKDTAGELGIIALVGILITVLVQARLRKK